MYQVEQATIDVLTSGERGSNEKIKIISGNNDDLSEQKQ